MAKAFIPARLEVRTEKGSEFVETFRVVREPELQRFCVEKRELRRILKILMGQPANLAASRPLTPN